MAKGKRRATGGGWRQMAPLIPLVLFTRRRDIMGSLVNSGITTAVAVVVVVVISALNVSLLVLTIAYGK